MRSGLRAGAVAVAIAVGFALPASATAKVVTYGGDLTPSGTIAIDVAVKKKKPKKVVEIRARDFPVNCDVSGDIVAWTKLAKLGVKVKNGGFTFKTVQPGSGNVTKITGEFKRKGRIVGGGLTYSHHFPPEPPDFPAEEDCDSGTLLYSATRGGDDVVVPPPARAAGRRG